MLHARQRALHCERVDHEQQLHAADLQQGQVGEGRRLAPLQLWMGHTKRGGGVLNAGKVLGAGQQAMKRGKQQAPLYAARRGTRPHPPARH